MNYINIALASDDNYAQHIAVVATSVLCNVKQGANVKFFVLSDGITSIKKSQIKDTVEEFCSTVEFIELNDTDKFDDLYVSGHISKAAYLRICLADVLPLDISKVIYLDVDLVVKGDINELWMTDIAGFPIAAVPDLGILTSKKSIIEKKKNLSVSMDEYFNSGVLILDLIKWRQFKYTRQLIELIKNVKFTHHDQDALNKFFDKNWFKLPFCWNVIPPVFCLAPKVLLSKKFKKDAMEAKLNMAICHYAGRYKPWEFKPYNGYNDIYYRYLAMTAFKDVRMPQPGNDMRGKSIFRWLFKLKIAEFICYVYN